MIKTLIYYLFNYILKLNNKYKFFNQKGQTLVEFILLLLVITFMSAIFLSLVNDNISSLWTKMVNQIVAPYGSVQNP